MKHNPEEPSWPTIDRYLAGEATRAEVSKMEAWANVDFRNKLEVEVLRQGLTTAHTAIDVTPDDIGHLTSKIIHSASTKTTALVPDKKIRDWFSRGNSSKQSYWWNVAWILPIVAVVGIKYMPFVTLHPSPLTRSYTTQPAQRAEIRLPDGSDVILAPSTTIHVTGRTVQLDGEAIFTVNHHGNNPFLVNTGSATIRVLGTTFAVRHYAQDSVVRVAVRNGRVAIAKANLDAGDIAKVTTQRMEILHNQPVEDAMLFARGGFMLKETPLSSAIPDIERWFDVKIEVANSNLLSKRISGTITGSSISDLEEILVPTLNVRAVRHGRILTLYPAK